MNERIVFKLGMLDLLVEAIKELQNAQANIDSSPEGSESELAAWFEYDKALDGLFDLYNAYRFTMSDEAMRQEQEVTLLRLPLRVTNTA